MSFIFSPRTNEVLLWESCMGMGHVFGGSTVPRAEQSQRDDCTALPVGLVLSEIEGLNLNGFFARAMPVIANIKQRTG